MQLAGEMLICIGQPFSRWERDALKSLLTSWEILGLRTRIRWTRCSVLTLFLCLYVYESSSSLCVSQFPFLEADGGAHTLFIYVLFDLCLTSENLQVKNLGSVLN